MTIELDEEATKRFIEIMENPKPMRKEVLDHFKRNQEKFAGKIKEKTNNQNK